MSNVGNIDITYTAQSIELRMRHLVAGHPGAVLSLAEVPVLIGKLEAALASAKGTAPVKLTGTNCAECGKPQMDTPSGVTCENGHGGADAAEEDPFGDLI